MWSDLPAHKRDCVGRVIPAAANRESAPAPRINPAPRIVAGVTRQLFLDNADAEYAAITGSEFHELTDVASAAE